MATDEEGRFGYAPVLDALYSTLVLMAGEGFLSPDEFRRMAIPTVGRSRQEFAGPFDGDGRFAGLAIERLEIFAGEDRIWEDYERTGDAEASGRNGRASRAPPSSRRWRPRSILPVGRRVRRNSEPARGGNGDAARRGAGADGDAAGEDGAGEAIGGRSRCP